MATDSATNAALVPQLVNVDMATNGADAFGRISTATASGDPIPLHRRTNDNVPAVAVLRSPTTLDTPSFTCDPLRN